MSPRIQRNRYPVLSSEAWLQLARSLGKRAMNTILPPTNFSINYSPYPEQFNEQQSHRLGLVALEETVEVLPANE